MVWKLKKAKATDDESADTQGVAPSPSSVDDSAEFALDPNPAAAAFVPAEPAEGEPVDLYAERMAAVDDAIASLTNVKVASDTPAANGVASPSAPFEPVQTEADGDDDDWSLDAFAPYKPPQKSPPKSAASPDNGAAYGEDAADPISLSPPVEEIDFTKRSPTASVAPDTDEAPVTEAVLLDDDIDFLKPRTPAEIDESDFQVSDDIEPVALAPLPIEEVDADEAQPSNTRIDISDASAAPDQARRFSAPTQDIDRTLTALPDSAAPHDGDLGVSTANAQEVIEPALTPAAPAAPAAQPHPRLEVKLGPFAANYDLTTDATVIGRPDPTTGDVPEIAIEWDDAISRRHAQVIMNGGTFYLVDLDSRNGTFLNGSRLPAQTPVALTPGDKIIVGERTVITFLQ